MSDKMICPACGTEMNLHAEKLIYRESELSSHAVLNETIVEAHTCPHCGRNESRNAEWHASE